MLTVTERPRHPPVQGLLKRALDVTGALALLIVLSPVLGILYAAVRFDSPGSALFAQERVGLGGRSFRILKFRTMRTDAEHMLRADSALYATYVANGYKLPSREDPRVSRLGRALRSTSLDELPQLINVLRGDMSLVGPRPVVGPELDHYDEVARRLVLGVRPGLTGYWQVVGRGRVSYPERVTLDVFYVTSWSLALDLKILMRTIPAVLQRDGAL